MCNTSCLAVLTLQSNKNSIIIWLHIMCMSFCWIIVHVATQAVS